MPRAHYASVEFSRLSHLAIWYGWMLDRERQIMGEQWKTDRDFYEILLIWHFVHWSLVGQEVWIMINAL